MERLTGVLAVHEDVTTQKQRMFDVVFCRVVPHNPAISQGDEANTDFRLHGDPAFFALSAISDYVERFQYEDRAGWLAYPLQERVVEMYLESKDWLDLRIPCQQLDTLIR